MSIPGSTTVEFVGGKLNGTQRSDLPALRPTFRFCVSQSTFEQYEPSTYEVYHLMWHNQHPYYVLDSLVPSNPFKQ